MTRQLHLGGFQIASQVTHSHAAWRHPGSDTRFTTPDYYHRIGRILERGKFDFVFFADLLAAPVRYGDDITEPLRRGTQATATLDPSIVAASIGAVTSKLGIAITKSATYFHPCELARIFSSSPGDFKIILMPLRWNPLRAGGCLRPQQRGLHQAFLSCG